MSEEEIIKNIKHWLNITEYHRKNEYYKIDDYIQGLLDLYNKEKNNINKLIRYIAIREDKDFEQVMKEFEIGG